MASKPFYSMEEVCEKLGKSPDDIKALVRDGTLREFRDAGKVFFKAEDIENLAGADADASPSHDTGEIMLEPGSEPTDTSDDDLTTLADSAGGTSIIGLEPLEDEQHADEPQQEDTVITASGIGVFDDDELEIADPMADTQITSVASDDQVSLESAGSGSGLLDLAREADDTALGADLLDEIYPGEEDEGAAEAEVAAVEEPEPVAVAAPAARPPAAADEAYEEPVAATAPVIAVAAGPADPAEGLLSGLLAGGLIVMGVASTVIAGVLQGYLPDYGRFLADGQTFYIFFLGGSVLLTILTLVLGWFLGKAFGPRRR